MFRAILNANEHGEPVSVGFPISKSVYADTITKLQQRSMIQKSGHFEYDENLDDFYNYGDYGAARIREETGFFADRGDVSYHGTLGLDELMHPDPAEEYRQERGLEMM